MHDRSNTPPDPKVERPIVDAATAEWDDRVSAVFFGSAGVVPDTHHAEWGEIAVEHPDGEIQRIYVDFTTDDPPALPLR